MADNEIKTLKQLGAHIKKALGSSVVSSVEVSKQDELVLTIEAEKIKDVFSFLKDDKQCYFKQLIDICAVDYPERSKRFEVVYHLLSLKNNTRLRVKLLTDKNTPVDTVSLLYPTAGWFEREVWDMFGVFFNGHLDLRRILTDYGFDGHPLRKDFPLTGFVETRYDEDEKRVIYEPVELMQDFRKFDYDTPWEGLTDVQSLVDKDSVKPKFVGGGKE